MRSDLKGPRGRPRRKRRGPEPEKEKAAARAARLVRRLSVEHRAPVRGVFLLGRQRPAGVGLRLVRSPGAEQRAQQGGEGDAPEDYWSEGVAGRRGLRSGEGVKGGVHLARTFTRSGRRVNPARFAAVLK